ncbi:MAG: HemK2/MTQ2 family protein methyltransferase [Natronomonas sp.]
MKLANRREMPSVYQPAEDSHLLAIAAAERIDAAEFVLEVGIGTGYVAEYVRDRTGANVVGSDVNPEACRIARTDRHVPTVQGNLVEPFQADCFDVVLFNPPYLPTDPEDEWADPLECALSGGPDGRRAIRPFLKTVGRVLVPEGRVYLLLSTLTGIDAVESLARDASFGVDEVASEPYPFERLVVLELRLL